MRRFSQALAAHIASGETTLCRAWRVTLRDGAVLGFTEHDAALAFAGTHFAPASGFAATEARAMSGLAATGAEIRGGFSSEAITEADLAAGRYDGARVEVFLVNWQAPEAAHARLSVEEIGEVTRAGPGFSAELRSVAHRLQQPAGRIYNRRCDADLGDGRCGVNMAAGLRRMTGLVGSVKAADRLVITGLPALDADLAAGHFRLGHCRFEGGVLAGQRLAIEESGATVPAAPGPAGEAAAGVAESGDMDAAEAAFAAAPGATMELRLWLPMEASPAPGDPVVLTVGCDKSFTTCRTRFGNALNFRGFPHMPGSDFAYSYVSGDSTHDGSVLFE